MAPEKLPLLSPKLPMPVRLVGLPPVCAISETSPVGVAPPDPGATLTVKFAGWPCVRVVGERLASAVVVGAKLTEAQFFTRLVAFTEPSPVARS